ASAHATLPAGLLGIDGNAGAAHVPVVLHVAVEVVGDLVIDRNVVHLPNWQRDAMEPAPVYRRDEHPGIVGDDETVRIGRIDPDVVGVAAPADLVKALTPVQRLMERAIGDIDLVVGSSRYRKTDVVAGAPDQRALGIDEL